MSARRRRAQALLALGLVAGAASVWACGACDEDKMAATYDDAVLHAATAQHSLVVFFAVQAPLFDADALRHAAASTAGVTPGSVRVSSEPAAVSFALDPAVQSPEDAAAAVQRRLQGEVPLRLLRTLPATASP